MNHREHAHRRGRRLNLERCELRRMLSASTADGVADQVPEPFVLNASADWLAAASGSVGTPVFTNGFLPARLGSGTVAVDADSDLVTIDTSPAYRYAIGGSSFGAVTSAEARYFLESLPLSKGLLPVVDGSLDLSVGDAIEATPPVTVSVGDDSLVESSISSPTTPFTPFETPRNGNDAAFSFGGISVDAPVSNPRTELPLDTDGVGTLGGNDEDWLVSPGAGSVTPPIAVEGPSIAVETNVDQPTKGEAGDSSLLPESDATADEPIANDPPKTSTAPLASLSEMSIPRAASRPAPPAGTNDPGAGAIDLTELLFADDGDAHSQANASVAQVTMPAENEHAARDVALAIESWVRAIPTPATQPTRLAAPDRPGTESATIGSIAPLRRSTGSVTMSIDGNQLSEDDNNRVSSGAEEIEVGTSAAVRIERPSVYRYAVSALSALLGGAVLSVARGRGSDAGADPRPGRVGRPRPGQLGRDFRPSCE